MATSNTEYAYFWYARLGPKVNTIGICTEYGEAVDSGLSVELYAELTDDVQSFTNDAEFLLRDEYISKFRAGVINDYLEDTFGKTDARLLQKYEEGVKEFRALQRTNKYGNDKVKPMNMRSDKYRYYSVRSENT